MFSCVSSGMALLLSLVSLSLLNLILGTKGIQIPCGSSFIDPLLQACCMNEGGQGPFTPFDFGIEICCNGEIFPLIEGTREEVICCGGTIIPNPQQQDCCGDELFDPNEGICCNGVFINDADALSVCCGEAVISQDQNCCNGAPFGEGQGCCGGEVFDASTNVCCRNMVTPNPGISLAGCCPQGDGTFGVFNTENQLCCNGQATDQESNEDDECCGTTTINSESEICCDGTAVMITNDNVNPGCCGTTEAINLNTHICCDGTGRALIGISPMNAQCCGESVIDTSTNVCCGDQSFPIADGANPTPEACCTLAVLNQGVCCNGVPFPSDVTLVCCGDTAINPETQRCCGTTIIEPEQTCCNGQVLGDNQVCCGTEILQGTDRGCCGRANTIFPVSDFRCCGEFLVALPSGADPNSLECCSNTINGVERFFPRLFNPTNEFCCNGRNQPLNDVVPANADCCGPTVYDTATQRCCRNRVFPIDSNNPRCQGLPPPTR